MSLKNLKETLSKAARYSDIYDTRVMVGAYKAFSLSLVRGSGDGGGAVYLLENGERCKGMTLLPLFQLYADTKNVLIQHSGAEAYVLLPNARIRKSPGSPDQDTVAYRLFDGFMRVQACNGAKVTEMLDICLEACKPYTTAPLQTEAPPPPPRQTSIPDLFVGDGKVRQSSIKVGKVGPKKRTPFKLPRGVKARFSQEEGQLRISLDFEEMEKRLLAQIFATVKKTIK